LRLCYLVEKVKKKQKQKQIVSGTQTKSKEPKAWGHLHPTAGWGFSRRSQVFNKNSFLDRLGGLPCCTMGRSVPGWREGSDCVYLVPFNLTQLLCRSPAACGVPVATASSFAQSLEFRVAGVASGPRAQTPSQKEKDYLLRKE
jgi:hypothetical protein